MIQPLRIPDDWLFRFRGSNCAKCPLKPKIGTTPQVPAEIGPILQPIVIVGEAPGEVEKISGRPFTGKSGMLLRRLLMGMKCFSHQLLVTNVVKCQPPGNRQPTPSEIELCQPLLEKELELVTPRVIIPLGAVATSSILGRKTLITKAEGETYDTIRGRVVPAYHPAAVLRNPTLETLLVKALTTALSSPTTIEPFPEMEIVLDPPAIQKPLCPVTMDIETTGIDAYAPGAGITMIGIKFMGLARTLHLTNWREFEMLRNWLVENPLTLIIGHNIKFDLLWLVRFGIFPKDVLWRTEIWDTLSNYALIDENAPRKDLKYLCRQLFHVADWGLDFSQQISTSQLAEYNSIDLSMTEKLYLWERDHSIPYVLNSTGTKVVVEMESNGVFVDLDRLCRLQTEQVALQTTLKQGLPVSNPNSTKQWTEFLFVQNKLKPAGRTEKGVPSTNEESLTSILERPSLPPYLKEVVEGLLQYRTVTKRLSFLDSFEKFTSPEETVTPRVIHPKYELCWSEEGGAVTGRLSSHDPNLQQQTGYMLSCLKSRFPGGKVLIPDLSQIELRVLAHISQDENLIEVCRTGDLHQTVSDRIITPRTANWGAEKQRNLAKKINFAVVYLATPSRLVKEIPGITMSEAEEFIDAWYSEFPGVAKWQEVVMATVLSSGKVENMFGRVRHLPGASHNTPSGRHILRQAVNFPIQSVAAALLLNGIMPNLISRLRYQGLHSLVVGNIHDALVVDVHPEEEEVVKDLLKEDMTNPPLPSGGRWSSISNVPIQFGYKDLDKYLTEEEGNE